MKRMLIIGMGEVGSAIFAVLADKYMVYGYDPKLGTEYPEFKANVLHICIPYGNDYDFHLAVEQYQQELLEEGGLTIIHSTVPIGTCNKLGAVHSPVRGKHPDLTGGVKTFYKFFGGFRALEAAQIFMDAGVKCITTPDARNTEAMKLYDTTLYGLNIIAAKMIQKSCEDQGLDFNVVYSLANRSYNEGYALLGMPQFTKYVIDPVPGPIGGHCVIPNAQLLKDEGDELGSWVVEMNEKLK